MMTLYFVLAIILFLIGVVATVGNTVRYFCHVEYVDRAYGYKPSGYVEKSVKARHSLVSMGIMIGAWFWPVSLPLATLYIARVMYKDVKDAREDDE